MRDLLDAPARLFYPIETPTVPAPDPAFTGIPARRLQTAMQRLDMWVSDVNADLQETALSLRKLPAAYYLVVGKSRDIERELARRGWIR